MKTQAHFKCLVHKELLVLKRNWFTKVSSLTFSSMLMLVNWYFISRYPQQPVIPIQKETDLFFAYGVCSDINQVEIQGIPNILPFWASFLQKGNTIGVVNNTLILTSEIINYFQNLGIDPLIFQSEAELRNYAMKPSIIDKRYNVTRNLTTAIKFDYDKNDHLFKYTIYTNKFRLEDVAPNYISNLQSYPQIDKLLALAQNGELVLQAVADSLILKNITNKQSAKIDYVYTPMYVGKTSRDLEGLVTRFFEPVIFVISGVLIFIELVTRLLEYKTSRMREVMAIMGMTDLTFFMAEFIYFTFEVLVGNFFITLIIYFGIFKTSNPILIYIFFCMYNLCFYPYTIVIISICTKKVYAITLGIVFYFVSFEIVFVTTNTCLSTSLAKFFLSLLPSISFTNGISIFSQCSADNFYLGFLDIFSFQSYGFSIGYSLIFFIVDFIWLLFLGLYLDSIIPNIGGRSKDYLYFTRKEFWSRKPFFNSDNCNDESNVDNTTFNSFLSDKDKDQDNGMELTLQGQKDGQIDKNFKSVSIRNLSKTFPNGFEAVKNINLDIFQDEIFVLLGHNGAGKTTLVSMLSGLIKPTKGKIHYFENKNAKINSCSLFGYCPQQNLFFESLSVEEHLNIFGLFKGLCNQDIRIQSQKLITDLDLETKKFILAENLSYGDQRKLGIAMACIGNPSILFLDEPTAGLETTIRNEVWNILREYKKNSSIILTTHYMEEADLIGDKILMMNKGMALCYGSPQSLKSEYAMGYSLVIHKPSLTSSEEIFTKIKLIIPEACLVSNSEIDSIIRLPFSSTHLFEELFKDFNYDYTLQPSNIEDVFIKFNPTYVSAFNLDSCKRIQEFNFNFNNLQKVNLWKQVKLIWNKKIIELRRKPMYLILHFIVPVLLSFLFFMSFLIMLDPRTHEYSLYDFPQPQRPIYNAKTYNDKDATFMINPLLSKFELTIINVTKQSNFREFAQRINFIAANTSFKTPLLPYRYGGYSLLDYDLEKEDYSLLVLYNFTNVQTALNYANLFMKSLASTKGDYEIYTKLSQIKLQTIEKIDSIFDALTNEMIVPSFAILFTYSPAFFCMYLVREIRKRLKFMQLLYGVSKFSYWFANLSFDILIMELSILFTIPVILSFQSFDIPYAPTVLLIMGPSLVMFASATSFLFDDDSTSFIAHGVMHAIISTCLPLIPFIVWYKIPESNLYLWITAFVSLIPSSGFTCVLNSIYMIPVMNIINKKHGPYKPLEFDCGGLALIIIMIDFALYLGIIIYIELSNQTVSFQLSEKSRHLELEKVKENEHKKHADKMISFNNVSFSYENNCVLKNVSFSVGNNEILCLLGRNGSGKTTTIKLVINEIEGHEGNIQIDNIPVNSKIFHQIKQSIGYCPQTNIIFDQLTVYENLLFFAKIKGVPDNILINHIDQIIYSIDLQNERLKKAVNLSGGNKRKLAIAISLINNPRILILDEPSNGIDPLTRRSLWQLLRMISKRRENCCILLATHSLNEAENLGTNYGIIDKTFKYLGNKNEITQLISSYYIVELYLSDEKSINSLSEELKNCLKATIKFKNVDNHVTVKINAVKLNIGSVFRFFEQRKGVFNISKYTVRKSTFEETFNKILKHSPKGVIN